MLAHRIIKIRTLRTEDVGDAAVNGKNISWIGPVTAGPPAFVDFAGAWRRI